MLTLIILCRCTTVYNVEYDSTLVFRTKKTGIVDVVIVISVMWAKGWGRGVRGKSQRVGSSYLARDQSGWGFATMSKKLAFQVSRSFLLFLQEA